MFAFTLGDCAIDLSVDHLIFADPVLAARQRLGLAIHARTGVPKWFGERMDYNEAVGALQDRRGDRGSA